MPVFLHSTDPELYKDKRASDYVVKKLTKKYAKTGAFAKTVKDDAKFNLFIGLLDQLENELTKFQTYYTEYSTQDYEGAPSTRRKKKISSKKDIKLVRGEIGLGSIVGLIKRCDRILSSYPNFNTLNPRDIATLTKSYEDLMIFVSGFQDLTESTDDYRAKLEQARDELENWNPSDYDDEFQAEEEKQELKDFIKNARLIPPQRIQGVAGAFYADLYNFLVAFRTKLNIYETDPDNKTPPFGAKASVSTASVSTNGDDGDDGDDGENHGFDALEQEAIPRSGPPAPQRPSIKPFPRVPQHSALVTSPFTQLDSWGFPVEEDVFYDVEDPLAPKWEPSESVRVPAKAKKFDFTKASKIIGEPYERFKLPDYYQVHPMYAKTITDWL